MKIKIIKTIICFFITANLFSQDSSSNITLSGYVYNSVDKEPLDFTTVALPELKIKTRTNAQGYYSIDISQAGKYTIFISSPGLKTLKAEIEITESTKKDFFLGLATLKGETLEIKAEREVQKISRYSMTAEEIKSVPGSFGDSLSALTSLPGIIKMSGGFFGPMIIRGADASYNRYFIDDIPVYEPQHFMGFHSIISSDLMSEIDLYASAYPAEFGQAGAAVIDINTVDDVKKLSGVSDVSLITSSVLIKAPLYQSNEPEESIENDQKSNEEKISGYYILSGRYSYFEIFLPYVIEFIIDEKIEQFPKYWDYQLKGKYFLLPKHALTIFLFGFEDKLAFARNLDENENEEPNSEYRDPLIGGVDMKNDVNSHVQSVRYTYRASEKFQNDLVLYSVLNEGLVEFSILGEGITSAFQDITITTNPDVYGLKNILKVEYIKDFSEIRFISEANYYDFKAYGKSLIPKANTKTGGGGPPDLAQDLFEEVIIDHKGENVVLSGALENKFTFAGLKLVPAVRLDYLARTKTLTTDPRGMISYEFESETTIAAAGGYYSSFLQVNPYYFKSLPEMAKTNTLPERAIHRSVSIEQKIDLYAIKLEGYYNNFYDLVESDPHINEAGEQVLTRSTGKRKNYGIEVMLRKDKEEKANDFYGWLSYTYTQAKHKTGLALDDTGNIYIPFESEQPHSIKLVSGYVYDTHSIEGKFQLYSSFPYTPIVGSKELPPNSGRYSPVYGEKNSERLPISHQLDLRYSKRTNYEWGYIKWYFELLNVYNYHSYNYRWSYNKPYKEGVNPETKKSDGLAFSPTFGVEARF
ncbi:MAG: TonB-dependent receptor [Spirochaetia bacterium]|nr:TonB-dependent receptor [Spirochaetia bacterium]